MYFVNRDSRAKVALTHGINKTSLSIIPLDVEFSGVALVRVKRHRPGSTTLITTASHVVIYGKKGVVVWKQPLGGLAVESHGLDLIRLTTNNEFLEFGTGFSRRKKLIAHLIAIQRLEI